MERQPDKPGFVRVRFYENVQAFSEQDGELTISGYEYDEYRIEVRDNGRVHDFVLQNFDRLLAQAKVEEVEPEPEPTMAELKAENAALTQRVETLEDALCEVDEANEERLSAMEDALCEMDEIINGGDKS